MSNQIILRLAEEKRERLKRAADATKAKNSQEVLEDLIDLYLDVYVSTSLSIRGAIQKQSIQILSNIGGIELTDSVLIADVGENLNELIEEDESERNERKSNRA
jgi:predicted DNA-binding protein